PPAPPALRALPTRRSSDLVTVADAKNIYRGRVRPNLFDLWVHRGVLKPSLDDAGKPRRDVRGVELYRLGDIAARVDAKDDRETADRKSTRLNSSHVKSSYA